MDKIQSLIQRHEDFKALGIRTNLDNLFDWNALLELMKDTRTTLTSELVEKKNSVKNEKASRGAELRLETNEQGKKKNTESSIEDTLRIEFEVKDQELEIARARIEMLTNKIECLPEYIQLAKRNLPQ